MNSCSHCFTHRSPSPQLIKVSGPKKGRPKWSWFSSSMTKAPVPNVIKQWHNDHLLHHRGSGTCLGGLHGQQRVLRDPQRWAIPLPEISIEDSRRSKPGLMSSASSCTASVPGGRSALTAICKCSRGAPAIWPTGWPSSFRYHFPCSMSSRVCSCRTPAIILHQLVFLRGARWTWK